MAAKPMTVALVDAVRLPRSIAAAEVRRSASLLSNWSCRPSRTSNWSATALSPESANASPLRDASRMPHAAQPTHPAGTPRPSSEPVRAAAGLRTREIVTVKGEVPGRRLRGDRAGATPPGVCWAFMASREDEHRLSYPCL